MPAITFCCNVYLRWLHKNDPLYIYLFQSVFLILNYLVCEIIVSLTRQVSQLFHKCAVKCNITYIPSNLQLKTVYEDY